MSEYLQSQIASRRARLKAIEQERLTLEGELRAYEDALARTIHHWSIQLSQDWIAILRDLAGHKRFNSRDVQIASHRLGMPRSAVNVRSQLSLYTKKEIVKRLGGGNYQLTDRTKIALKEQQLSSPKNTASSSNADKDLGHRGERPQ